MFEEFDLPVHPADLLLRGGSSAKYGVDERKFHLDSDKANRVRLEEVAEDLHEDSSNIVDHKNFDVLFNYINQFVNMSADTRNLAVDVTVSGLRSFCAFLSNGSMAAVEDNAKRYRNALKLYVFLHYMICTIVENDLPATEPSAPKVVGAPKKSKGKNGGGETWNWENSRLDVLLGLSSAVVLSVGKLWPMGLPEENYIAMFAKTSVLMLENPSHCKSTEAVGYLFIIFNSVVRLYNQDVWAISVMVNLLFKGEHLPPLLADLCVSLLGGRPKATLTLKASRCPTVFPPTATTTRVVNEVLREVAKLAAEPFDSDLSGAKNVAAFLAALAEEAPVTLLPHLSSLLTLLDSEAYALRNGVVQMMGTLVGGPLAGEAANSASSSSSSSSEASAGMLNRDGEANAHRESGDSEGSGEDDSNDDQKGSRKKEKKNSSSTKAQEPTRTSSRARKVPKYTETNESDGSHDDNDEEDSEAVGGTAEATWGRAKDEDDDSNSDHRTQGDYNGSEKGGGTVVAHQRRSRMTALDGDNGSLVALSATVAIDLKAVPSMSPQSRRSTRDQLLCLLEDRLLDKSSYTRSRVLQTLGSLAEGHALPLKRLPSTAALVLRHLDDSASIVRRQALKALTTLLQHNPFSGSLAIADFEGQLTQAKAALALLLQSSTGPSEGEEAKAASEGNSASLLSVSAPPSSEADSPTARASSDDHDEADDLVFPSSSSSSSQSLSSSSIGAAKFRVSYLTVALEFVAVLSAALLPVTHMLGSANTTDIVEAIQFVTTAASFRVEAGAAVKKMLLLIFSKDASVKAAVLAAYNSLYIAPAQNLKATLRAAFIAKNLIALTHGATLAELTALEELVGQLRVNGSLDGRVLAVLWEIFSGSLAGVTKEQGLGAAMVLGMIGSGDPRTLSRHFDTLVTVGLPEETLSAPCSPSALQLGRYVAVALTKLSSPPVGAALSAGPTAVGERHASSSPVAARLSSLVLTPLASAEGLAAWFPAAEQALNALYAVVRAPDSVAAVLIKSLAQEVFGASGSSSSVSGSALSRLLFVVSHTALRHLVYIEEAQRAHSLAAQAKLNGEDDNKTKTKSKAKRATASEGKGGRKNGTAQDEDDPSGVSDGDDSAGTTDDDDDDDQGGDSRGKETSKGGKAGNKSGKDGLATGPHGSAASSMGDDLGLGAAAAEDAQAEFIAALCESALVTDNLLGAFGPLIVTVCKNREVYSDALTRASAALALSKFMTVSSKFCEENLQLLFTILETDPDEGVRSNIVIALGDLVFRYPNLLEPWTPRMYSRLTDGSERVRKNMLMVLTHLILNDMVKVKGQIATMALCLVDGSKRVADLSSLFFHELSLKNNAIYNILPDVISHLSNDSALTSEAFRTIMAYLFSFVSKDKQQEALIVKLCHRFPTTVDDVHPRNIAFCLSLLSYTDRGIKRLIEMFRTYSDKLVDDEVHSHFENLIAKSRKFARADLKTALDALEAKVSAGHRGQLGEGGPADELEDVDEAIAAATVAASTGGGSGSRAAASKAAKNKKTGGKVVPAVPAKKGAQTSGRQKGKKAAAKVDEEDDLSLSDESDIESLSLSLSDDDDDDDEEEEGSDEDDDDDEEEEEEEDDQENRPKNKTSKQRAQQASAVKKGSKAAPPPRKGGTVAKTHQQTKKKAASAATTAPPPAKKGGANNKVATKAVSATGRRKRIVESSDEDEE